MELLVSACQKNGISLNINEFALSCRAMGRKIEDAFLEELIGFTNDQKLKNINIDVYKTSRNKKILLKL